MLNISTPQSHALTHMRHRQAFWAAQLSSFGVHLVPAPTPQTANSLLSLCSR
jgi:hypothetical protein